MFIGLLISIANASNHIKCVSLSYQKCIFLPTLINLKPNKYTPGLCYYPFTFNLDRFSRSCRSLNDLSNNVFVSNKTEDFNLSVFTMMTGINESKILTKYVSCKCECEMWNELHFQIQLKWIKIEIKMNAGARVKIKKTSWVRKRLYLESWYMPFWKWQICRKYYWWFSDYVWWNYRYNKKSSTQNCSNRF